MDELPDEEYKKRLTRDQYNVLRMKGTEAPFTGKYVHESRVGTYTCVACGAQLFDSNVKFDSGTGWPSFADALPGSVEFRDDESHGMRRTEVICSRCKSHLGHVFDDGPKAMGGKRYCINSVCLELQPSNENNTTKNR